MAYSNIPQVSLDYRDGNFDLVTESLQPRVLVLGTARDGRTDDLWRVGRVSAAVKEFKGYGTLLRGMYEILSQGSDNVSLRRLPTGTPAVLTGVCSDGIEEGITITTVQEDSDAGARYSIWFESSTGRLAIYDTEDEEWIYDTEEILAIDTGLISVEGSCSIGDGVDIGTQSGPVPMEDCPDIDASLVYTAGTDGDEPSLMELYEALDEAYEDLDWQSIDYVVPMGAYLDSLNVADMDSTEISTRALASLTDYPTFGTDSDVLGKVYRQDYLGKFYYWWDTDNDGIAEIFPSEGSASATSNINGEAIGSDEYHEVNFAYQLAEFCRKASVTWHTCLGFIGATSPDGFDRASLARWIGELPVYTELDDGSEVIASTADNGTGLLGNKFLAGKKNFRGSVKDGGFIKTEDGWLDGVEEEDENEHLIDIGKHIVICPIWGVHLNQYINPTLTTGSPSPYLANSATVIAGKYATLVEKEEANGLNGLIRAIRIDGLRIPGRLLNSLLGIRYVCIRSEPGVGMIVCGSKTAARPDSDWTKISTIRSVNRECQGLRGIFMRYLGKEMSHVMKASIQTATEGFLNSEKDLGYNNGYKFVLSSTASQRRLGQLKCDLKMVPPFAIESIDIALSLSEDESTL